MRFQYGVGGKAMNVLRRKSETMPDKIGKSRGIYEMKHTVV